MFALPVAALAAEDGAPYVPMSQLAPADEYFGHAKLSVLGIANHIKDAGARLDEGANPAKVFDGPLAFVEDSIRDWEHQFPNDPWIARDLYGLELAYLRAQSPRGVSLAHHAADWLVADYPDSPLCGDAQVALGYGPDPRDSAGSTADAWTRFAALRAPLPPH
ncbi:MAG TPA: hypothetical protein VGN14_19410 [Candidatus Elarobacter sp.]